jgi:hypothetical protein
MVSATTLYIMRSEYSRSGAERHDCVGAKLGGSFRFVTPGAVGARAAVFLGHLTEGVGSILSGHSGDVTGASLLGSSKCPLER